MKEPTRYNAHKKLLDELFHTYVSKNGDYGNSATKVFQMFGFQTYAARIYEKAERIASLAQLPQGQQNVKSESIRDTLMDLANYCLMAVMDLCAMPDDEHVKQTELHEPRVVLNVPKNESEWT